MDGKDDGRREGITRRKFLLGTGSALALGAAASGSASVFAGDADAAPGPRPGRGKPIRLHPDNPHYFLFRGRPTALVTSAEHYGAVVNLDFGYVPYFKELSRDGLNYTRIFSGAYVERDSSIPALGYENTLAPRPNRFVAPWARSSTPGYANGGNKFDLERWDRRYFARLKDFVSEAGRRGVVVEVTLFCTMYGDNQWTVSPMNAQNNVNGVGDVPNTQVHTLENGGLLEVQDALARKIVTELNGFDNVFFEVINEPYFAGVTNEWQDHIIQTIVDTQSSLPRQHLIAQNIANGFRKVEDPDPAVSIFNFHYALPGAAELNFGLNRVIGDDETGFEGTEDRPYRTEGWEFMISGGGLYNNLDWSFTPGAPDGSAVPLNPETPGGGSPTLRRQIGYLKEFIYGFDFVRMVPDNSVVVGGIPSGVRARALVEKGEAYAVYVDGGGRVELVIKLPAGKYGAEWLDTKTGRVAKRESFEHPGGRKTVRSPRYSEDIACGIKRKGRRDR